VTLSFAVTLALRYLLVMLFLPFSALDKILNFNGAVAQAREAIPSDRAARLVIVAALGIEIIMPLGILTGWADRLAALIMAGYCGITALLWKQFWRPGDFWSAGKQPGARPVLGLPQESLPRRRVPAHHLRHGHATGCSLAVASATLLASVFGSTLAAH